MIPTIDEANFIKALTSQKNPFAKEYYAFYSSWLGGVTTNPHLMLLPMDDHMVHRGDGVFEAMKAVDRSVYLMQEHLERLFDSAAKISLKLNFDLNYVKEIVVQTLQLVNKNEASVRIFISRGPGDFSANPYDAIEPQLYVVVMELHAPAAAKYLNGVVIGESKIPIKDSWLAQIKSCNYLPNVLMKMESVDRGLDFVIGIDERGLIAEGPTENIMLVDQNDTLLHPPFANILKGITMMRTCELARKHGFKTEIKPISEEDLRSAREVVITGTSLNVLPVVKFENYVIGNGKPGPIAKKLNELLIADIEAGTQSQPY